MERRNYIIAVDLGSSNVTVAVGEQPDDGGLLEVVYIVRKPVEGVNAGQIENSELAGNAIHAAIEEVEQALGCRITEVYAGISGEFVRCACYTDHVYIGNPHDGVSHADVESLFSRMRNVQAPEGETIMERIPQSYVVDGTREVKNPVGSFGKTLSATFNFVLCNTTPLQRLEMVFKRHGITIKGIFPTVLAIPEAVLSPDEKSEGVAVVDIGGGVTDVTVYYRNVVRYVASIPMGAAAINHDIRTMGVPEKYVEQLKLEKGSAVAELAPDTLVKVPGRTPREEKGILKRNLATVIEARAMDIAEYVLQELKDSHFGSKLAYGIVLTGGSAMLKDLDTLFNRVTKMEVRVAAPDTNITDTSLELVDSPAYATVTGLLLLGAAQGASSLIVENPPVRPVAVPEVEAAEPESATPERPAAPQPNAPANPVNAATPRPRPAATPNAKVPTGTPQRTPVNQQPARPIPAPRPRPQIVHEEDSSEPLPAPETFKHVPPKPAAPTQERTTPIRTINSLYSQQSVRPQVEEQPQEQPQILPQPQRLAPRRPIRPTVEEDQLETPEPQQTGALNIEELYRMPRQPRQPREPEDLAYDKEAEERANATAKRMKNRIQEFFGKINGKWDDGSSSDIDEDTEI